jgi:2-methylaconitate cis-trans-isomerase PrpF
VSTFGGDGGRAPDAIEHRIPAVYMRGGALKGVFFQARDLPRGHRERDALLLRVMGCPDPSGSHADGMGCGGAGGSRVAIVSPSMREDCDVDFLLGILAADRAAIDWSGSCGHLAAAVGPYAISSGMATAADGIARVRIWQANLGKRIDAFVPVRGGQVIEDGSFIEDGVPRPSAEVRLEFLDPVAEGDVPGRAGAWALLPTGCAQEMIEVTGLPRLPVTLLAAGHPTVFLRAQALGLTGRELPEAVDRNRALRDRIEAIQRAAAARIGFDLGAGPQRSLLPRVVWVGRPTAYRSAGGVDISADRVDLLARTISQGRLEPSLAAGCAMAIAVAAALPGTVVNEIARTLPGVPTRIGHVTGTLAVGAEVEFSAGRWQVDKVVLSRSARHLMSGWVHVPRAGL